MANTTNSDRAELELESELIREMEAELESLKLDYRLKLEQLLLQEVEEEDDEDSCDITDDNDDVDDDSVMLLFASSVRWKQMFKILEADPTQIRAKTSDWNTALHMAARFDDLAVVKRLVGFGLKARDKKGNRLLSVSVKNKYGDTPLHMAAQIGNPKVAAYLTRKKPRLVYELNHEGFSPLYYAVTYSRFDMVEDMFTVLPPNDVPKEILDKVVQSPAASLAHAAIQSYCKLPILSLLLIHLPSVLQTPNVKGWKPLSYAAYKGHVDEVELILKNFPHCVEELDEDGSYPIHKAIVGVVNDVIEMFLSLCPTTVSQRDKNQRTILHIAARYDRMEMLKYLINEHSDKIERLLDCRDVNGKTFEDLAEEKDRVPS